MAKMIYSSGMCCNADLSAAVKEESERVLSPMPLLRWGGNFSQLWSFFI